MIFFQLLFSFSLYIFFSRAGFIQDKLLDGIEMHYDRLDTRCGGKNTPFQLFLDGIKTTSTKIFIKNNTLIVNEGGLKDFSLIMVIDRCRSKENLDTCEQFLKHENNHFCRDLNPDNRRGSKSPFYVPYTPPLRCPIRKDIYRASNITSEAAPLLILNNLEGCYWRVKYEVTSEQNKLILCVFLDGYVTNSKSKRT